MIFISFAKKTRQQGFTLIEVLVVTVLLAIITAIAIPLLRDNVVEAYVPEAEAVLASISTTAQRSRLLSGTSTAQITTCLFGEYIHFPRLNSYSSLVIA